MLLLSSFELIKSIWRSAGNYTEFFTVLDSSLGVAGEIVWLCAGFTRRHVTVSRERAVGTGPHDSARRSQHGTGTDGRAKIGPADREEGYTPEPCPGRRVSTTPTGWSLGPLCNGTDSDCRLFRGIPYTTNV